MASRYRSRRGSFGLQPVVAPNVTNTIVALAREYVAKRDSNIMDAWRNGGTFEGQKVTDDMVLAYWQGRMNDTAEGDPNYEAIKNNVLQLQYGIEQSKMDLLHVQGKISDTQFAKFYLDWAKKVPGNSEFYRTLQKDAAQLIEQAKTSGAAKAAAAKTKAFNEFVDATTRDQIAIGNALTDALTSISKETGLSITGNGDQLLRLLTGDVAKNPTEYRALLDAIHAADPTWDGTLTDSYVANALNNATQGYSAIADRAQKDGYVSAYANATKGESTMSQWGQNLKVWTVSQQYTSAENAWLRTMTDPNASQMAKMAASKAFSESLTRLAGTPGIDTGTQTMIAADAARLLGQDAGDAPSFGIAVLGRNGVTPEIATNLSTLYQLKAAMDANPTAFAYAPVDASGQFDATGKGAIGIVPAGSVQPGAQAVMIPGYDGQAVMAMVAPHSVYVTDPNDPTGTPKLAGYQISYKVGGQTVSLWGYVDAQGQNRWSTTSPVTAGATTQVDTKGDVYITPPSTVATDPLARAAELDKQMGTNMAAQLKAQQAAGSPLGATTTINQFDQNGHITGSVTLTYKNGTFTASQTQNTIDASGHVTSSQTTPINIAVNTPQAAAFSQSTLAAGYIPGTTFSSPLGASVAVAGATQTQDQVNKYTSDPAFQQAWLSQTMQTLGTQNPYDPRIAQAWLKVTTGTSSFGGEHTPDSIKQPSMRYDLQYPGVVSAEKLVGSSPGIYYGHAQLVIPTMPGQQYQPDYLDAAARHPGGMPTPSLPGLGVPQTPAGSPNITIPPGTITGPASITPTVTPTSGPTAPVGITGPATIPSTAPAPTTKGLKAL